MGPVSIRDDWILNGPLGRSPRLFVPPLTLFTRSAALYHTTLAPFMGSLFHFAHFLVGRLKVMNICSRCSQDLRKGSRLSSSPGTRPKSRARAKKSQKRRHQLRGRDSIYVFIIYLRYLFILRFSGYFSGLWDASFINRHGCHCRFCSRCFSRKRER